MRASTRSWRRAATVLVRQSDAGRRADTCLFGRTAVPAEGPCIVLHGAADCRVHRAETVLPDPTSTPALTRSVTKPSPFWTSPKVWRVRPNRARLQDLRMVRRGRYAARSLARRRDCLWEGRPETPHPLAHRDVAPRARRGLTRCVASDQTGIRYFRGLDQMLQLVDTLSVAGNRLPRGPLAPLVDRINRGMTPREADRNRRCPSRLRRSDRARIEHGSRPGRPGGCPGRVVGGPPG